jgi:hypothetical protein
MKKVICVLPSNYSNITVGKVYDVIKTVLDGSFEIKDDCGYLMTCLPLNTDDSHFKERIELIKQSVTIEVPEGYKIKSHKVVDNQVIVELEPVQNIVVVASNDTVIRVKPEFLEKLKELGVYDKWLTNVKAPRRGNWKPTFNMEDSPMWASFIGNSFDWSDTPEGVSYWSLIRYK